MEGDKLFEAACNGEVEILEKLIKENPSVLADIKLISFEKSLLHVATKFGRLNFVKKLLNIDPDFVAEQDKDGFHPLDIAVVMGNLEIVKELVRFNVNLVRIKGKDQRTVLHYAAIKGRVDVIDELVSTCPDAVEDITIHGETALHLAVRNFQFDAFAVLIKGLKRIGKDMELVVNMREGDGNTVLHLAVSTKQYMCIDLLLGKDSTMRDIIEVNARNSKGLTALDILVITFQDSHDLKIREILTNAKAKNSLQHDTNPKPINQEFQPQPSKNWFQYFKFQKQRDSPSDTRNTLLVVAVLIATVCFQAGVQPPNGIFNKPTPPPQAQAPRPSTFSDQFHQRPFVGPADGAILAAASAVLGTHATSFLFLFANSLGLTASLCIIIYLTSGFPFQRELHISLYSMMFTYGIAVETMIKGIAAKKKGVAYALVTVAFVLPFAQRWIPRWGKKAWRKWRSRRQTLLPLEH